MQEMHGLRNFDFVPYTLVLPRESEALRQNMEKDPGQWWIVKPVASSQGKGILISNKFNEIIKVAKGTHMVASHYISNPLLMDGLKFDLRIYVALTSINPLRLYIYEEGLTRFCTTPYLAPQAQGDGVNSKTGKYTHLTNYSINKNNKTGFIQNNGEDECSGSKWSISGLRKVLRANDIDDNALFAKIKDIIIKTFISVEAEMQSAFTMLVPNRTNCFQLFGFDILIDEKLNAWLLEVNLSPSLSCDSALD